MNVSTIYPSMHSSAHQSVSSSSNASTHQCSHTLIHQYSHQLMHSSTHSSINSSLKMHSSLTTFILSAINAFIHLKINALSFIHLKMQLTSLCRGDGVKDSCSNLWWIFLLKTVTLHNLLLLLWLWVWCVGTETRVVDDGLNKGYIHKPWWRWQFHWTHWKQYNNKKKKKKEDSVGTEYLLHHWAELNIVEPLF